VAATPSVSVEEFESLRALVNELTEEVKSLKDMLERLQG
jgi:hypothetical protein